MKFIVSNDEIDLDITKLNENSLCGNADNFGLQPEELIEIKDKMKSVSKNMDVIKRQAQWNADTLYEDLEHGYVEFKTAWSCPFPILGKLSEYTPIAVSFSDEDTGNNFGIVTIDKGIVTEHLSCLDYNNADSAEGQLKAIIAAGTIQDGGLENPSMQLFGNDNDEEVADELGVGVETYRKIADETIKETEHLLNTLIFCQ